MGLIESLDEKRKVLYSDSYFSGDYNQEMYLKRAVDDTTNMPKYYLSVWTNINGQLVQQGYLYFYLDFKNKASFFIGVKVEEAYRNLKIGSFLVASWINLCLNNGYDFLGTNKKQRKPFLIYLLKTYGFEILDKTLYATRSEVIDICRSIDPNHKSKLLMFKDKKHENAFIRTNVYKSDNYEIIHSSNGVITLDRVLLPLQNSKRLAVNYELLDSDLAQYKTQNVLSLHRK